MLQSSYLPLAPHLANPLYVCFTVSWPVKWFIEWLSQYIAPGRLALMTPWYLPYLCVACVSLVTVTSVNLVSKANNFFLISATWSSNAFLLTAVRLGLLSSCQFIFSNFFLSWDAHFSTSIVKVTSRLTYVCQQAFDGANIWVNPNIRSRSNQAKHPLMLLTMSNKYTEIPIFIHGNK